MMTIYFGDLGISNISQLLIPGASPTTTDTTRTDGGQQLATPPPADQSHTLYIQHMEDIDRTRSDVMNPADYTSKPFDRIPKPTVLLLQ